MSEHLHALGAGFGALDLQLPPGVSADLLFHCVEA